MPTALGTGKLGLLEAGGSGKLVGYQGDLLVLSGIDAHVGLVALTGQVANIGATTIYTPLARGVYAARACIEMTTGGGAATYSVNLLYTGDAGAQKTEVLTTVVSTTTGTMGNGEAFVVATAAVIQYSVSSGGAAGTYNVTIVLSRLS